LKFIFLNKKIKMLPLKVRKLREDAVLPTHGDEYATGWDITLTHVVERLNSTTVKYGTGLSIEPPLGFYIEIVPRSSIVKKGYMLSNSVGVIDENYRGELLVCLTKIAPEKPDLPLPDTTCQIKMVRREMFRVEEVGELGDTSRGAGGFGSTDTTNN